MQKTSLLPKILIALFIILFGIYFMPRDESSKSSKIKTQNDENAYLQPLDVPSAVKSLSKEDMSRFWGTYRSGHYLGLRNKGTDSAKIF